MIDHLFLTIALDGGEWCHAPGTFPAQKEILVLTGCLAVGIHIAGMHAVKKTL
jgi:hypothetical protein